MTTVPGVRWRAQPVERPGLRRRRRDDEERVLSGPRDRGVELDAAARVEHGRVDDAAGRTVEVRGEDALDRGERARSLHAQLGERGEVEQRDRLAGGAVLFGDRAEPVLAAVGVHVLRPLARPRVPHGALPAGRLAEAGAGGGEAAVQRHQPQAARGAGLQVRPVHRVQPAQRLAGALEEVARAGLDRREAAHVQVGRVHGRRARVDPLRERAADAGAEDDALRVHAGGDEEPGDLGGLAEQEVAVRREALRRAQVVRDARLRQRRHADARLGERPREVLQVRLELAEGEVRRDRRRRARPAVGLERADDAGRRGSDARRWSRRGRGRWGGREWRRPPARSAPSSAPRGAARAGRRRAGRGRATRARRR